MVSKYLGFATNCVVFWFPIDYVFGHWCSCFLFGGFEGAGEYCVLWWPYTLICFKGLQEQSYFTPYHIIYHISYLIYHITYIIYHIYIYNIYNVYIYLYKCIIWLLDTANQDSNRPPPATWSRRARSLAARGHLVSATAVLRFWGVKLATWN